MRKIGNNIKNELMEYMVEYPIINTHSHHLEERVFSEFNLDKLIDHTYLHWVGVTPGNTYQSRSEYLSKVKYKSYFVWLKKAIQQLHGVKEEITAENWEKISAKIQFAYEDPSFYMNVLKDKCNYQKIIVETYWNPGCDNGRPEIFKPSFRIDSFLYGYAKGKCDHDGVNPEKLYGELPDNLLDYLEWVRKWILLKKQQGCVALKSAIAYERDLYFQDVSREKAERIFRLRNEEKTQEDIENFQNYLFNRICEMAAEFSLPMQCHTGTGQLRGTKAIELDDIIRRNPDTKFVLLHCGYPWVDDIFGMVHEHQNVYPDLSWMPILSYTAAERAFHELIESSMSDKICWGCDTWTAEESYGALLAFRFVMSEVLEKKISDGYLSITDAKEIIENVMMRNAEKLYCI